MADHLVALRSRGPLCTKRIVAAPDGGFDIRPYGDARIFSVHRLPVEGLAGLSRALERVAADPRSFVIRGEPLPGTDLRATRRLLHEAHDPETGEVAPATFREEPRRWLMLDFDSQAEPAGLAPGDGRAAAHLRRLLPEPFRDVACWWSFTSGAGFKPGLRMRLAFWLDRPLAQWELELWLAKAPVDRSIFRPVQAIYVAHPVLEGVPDPVPRRSGLLLDGEDDVVLVPAIERPPEPPRGPPPRWHPDSRWARDRARERTPEGDLEAAARKVVETPEGAPNAWEGPGRHHALFCAALSVSRHVKAGRLARGDVQAVLREAAAIISLDRPGEVDRHIRNGLRAGGAM